jgi:hypothetical protein
MAKDITEDSSMRVIDQEHGDNYSLYQCDSIEGMRGLPEDSIHYSFFSPPFESLLVFSDSPRDLSNCKDSAQFAEHFHHFKRELYRVIMPGRLVSMHCCNLPTTVARHGYTGLQDFRGDLIRAMMGDAAVLMPAVIEIADRIRQATLAQDVSRAAKLTDAKLTILQEIQKYQTDGFIFHSEVVIWKDPGTQMKRSKSKSLKHQQIHKDATHCRMGIPDIIVTFRKPGDNPEPVGGYLFDYAGTDEESVNKFAYVGSDYAAEEQRLKDKPYKINFRDDDFADSVEVWNRYASPVWFDINPGDVLSYKECRGEKDERHISPTQYTVTRRCLQLWTNPGDIVLDPFNGRATTGIEAVKLGRKYVGMELKKEYMSVSAKDLSRLETQVQGQLAFA